MKLNLNAVLLFFSGVSNFAVAKANNGGARTPDAHKGRHYISPDPPPLTLRVINHFYEPIPGTKCKMMIVANMISARIAINLRSFRT